ncbi:hypothetical protein MWG07_09390 [Fusobacterium necrophorum]|uniref:Uncharacterized protein n=1 Tax=Fusobacterium necrophorum TaxID=859 RepID=A0AAW6WD32_9FUSO|nr:hypothetical protein [Fusobacterium necrophorum]MDK4481668.1 hypothetical protein [Fusobacterium necrophorum]MDK4512460.1 hypothetical protein [Fusobacterium necrophorum]
MGEKKRRGYATQKQQDAATKRYLATEKGKEARKKTVAKSQAKKFVKEFANLEELEELQNLIKKEREEMEMKKWEDVKESVNLSTDVNVDKDNLDKAGNCIVDITGGKYKGFSVVGKMVSGEDEDTLTIDDAAVLYDPAE